MHAQARALSLAASLTILTGCDLTFMPGNISGGYILTDGCVDCYDTVGTFYYDPGFTSYYTEDTYVEEPVYDVVYEDYTYSEYAPSDEYHADDTYDDDGSYGSEYYGDSYGNGYDDDEYDNDSPPAP